MRQTLDTAGASLAALNYDPWGTPEGSAVPPAFGFTGEWQDVGVGLVNLRARWYQPEQGRFTSRDPFQGFATRPYSFNPYQYGYSNPVLHVDPSGYCATEVGRRTCYSRGQSFLGQVAVAATREDFTLPLHRVFNHDPEVAALWVPDHPLVDAELRKLILQRAPGCDPFTLITFIKIEHAKWKIAHPEYGDWFDAAVMLGAGLLTLGNDEPVLGSDSGGGGGGSSRPTIAVKDLKPTHSPETSGRRPKLEKLSDAELMRSVTQPREGDPLLVDNTGRVRDGNGRTYELQRRATDPRSSITPDTRVPYEPYQRSGPRYYDE